ncbi:MAG: hypothetical protein AAGE76_14255 [Pseudomonadota bacterium]
MDYFSSVSAITKLHIDRAVDAFFERNGFDPTARTVVLIPGGLGSRLRRARHPFDAHAPEVDPRLSTVWVDCGLFLAEDAKKLFIDGDGLDTSTRIIIADGEVDFVIDPYDDAVRALRAVGMNVLLIGWDWRRKVPLAVENIAYALDRLDQRAKAEGHGALLPRITLVGHSMGGMVAKLLLTDRPDLAKQLAGMISVGSPFYGYFGQLIRFFEGAKYFNELYGARTVAQVTSSMPGLYELMPIDLAQYQDVGATLGLSHYPVTDLETGAVVDAHAATTQPRYPPWVRREQFARAIQVRQRLAAPLPKDVAARVHHIRGSDPESTVSAVQWNAHLPPDYDPAKSRSPLVHHADAGDHTIPLWSARLAQTPDPRVYDFTDAQHAFLMEDRRIIAKVAEIAGQTPRPASEIGAIVGAAPMIASSADAIAHLQAQRRGDAPQTEIKKLGDRLHLLGLPGPVARRIMQEAAM